MMAQFLDNFLAAAFFAAAVLCGLFLLKITGALAFGWSDVFSPMGALWLAQVMGLAWFLGLMRKPIDEGKK